MLVATQPPAGIQLRGPEANTAGAEGVRGAQAQLKDALVAYRSRHNRPSVQGGQLARLPAEVDLAAARASNEMAWRGPMRYGRGY